MFDRQKIKKQHRMFVSSHVVDVSNRAGEDKAGDRQGLAGDLETIKTP